MANEDKVKDVAEFMAEHTMKSANAVKVAYNINREFGVNLFSGLLAAISSFACNDDIDLALAFLKDSTDRARKAIIEVEAKHNKEKVRK